MFKHGSVCPGSSNDQHAFKMCDCLVLFCSVLQIQYHYYYVIEMGPKVFKTTLKLPFRNHKNGFTIGILICAYTIDITFFFFIIHEIIKQNATIF